MQAGERNWREAAACRSADPDLFFPISSLGTSLEQVSAAKAICATCLVRRECLAFALATRQVHGIWGGISETERYLTTASEGLIRDRQSQARVGPTAMTGVRHHHAV
jgi:WhiB family redox-sensing transcriptional regulator